MNIEYTKDGPVSYHAPSRTFVAEVSSLPRDCEGVEASITLRHKDGRQIEFVYVHAIRDERENETLGWKYQSFKGSKYPVTLDILND